MDHASYLYAYQKLEAMTSLYDTVSFAAQTYGDHTALLQPRKGGGTEAVTFSQLLALTDTLRDAMLARGLRGKHIALLGENSIQWIAAYFAAAGSVGVCVPIDRDLDAPTAIRQIIFSDAEFLLVSASGWKKLAPHLASCSALRGIVLLNWESDTPPAQSTIPVFTLEAFLAGGRAVHGQLPAAPDADPDAVCAIFFTSGTTGTNKGVMLSCRNILATLLGCGKYFYYPETSISVLPANHTYELHAHILGCIMCGTTVFLNDSVTHLLKNLKSFGPEMSCMVPMMLELMAKRLQKGIRDSGHERRFRCTMHLSALLLRCGIDLRSRLFSAVREPLGGRLKMVICGGAFLHQETVDFFHAIGVEVLNGYGITECAPVVSVNPTGRLRRDSVGKLLPTYSIRIADKDENGCGEIQLRGDNVMRGYYKMPEDTAAVFTEDGWFRTGDIGYCDDAQYLYLSGRLKNLIILPSGKNICPEMIEEALLLAIPYVSECVVQANSTDSALFALCYLDCDFCAAHALESTEDMAAFMQDDFRRFNASLPGFERLSDFTVVDQPFRKTTTHKIRRTAVSI